MNKHPLAKCDECPLREKTFFLQPSKPSRVLFVGGGPNEQEAFKGGFYSTPAGRLINNVCSFLNTHILCGKRLVLFGGGLRLIFAAGYLHILRYINKNGAGSAGFSP